MKHLALKWTAVFYFFYMSLSCISFKVPILPEPDNQIEKIVLCEDINSGDDLLTPVEIRSEFEQGTESVICFIQMRYTSREIELRWKWYSPEGQLQRDTGGITVNPENKYLDYITAYDRLRFESPPVEGDWTVAVFINDNLVSARRFKIIKITADINLNYEFDITKSVRLPIIRNYLNHKRPEVSAFARRRQVKM